MIRRGVLSVDFVESGTAITANGYSDTLTKLSPEIQNRGKLSSVIIFPNDNARPHSTSRTKEKAEDFGG